MIFPDLPRHHYFWMQQQDQTYFETNSIDSVDSVPDTTTKAPLQGPALEQWLADHSYYPYALGPAARPSYNEPIDWFARDALEFYALCMGLAAWIVYWYGFHRSLW